MSIRTHPTSSVVFGSEKCPISHRPSRYVEELPKIFEHAKKGQSKYNTGLVHNSAALYPLYVDGKDFESLDRIFMLDVVVNMSTVHPIVRGLPLLKETLRGAFDGLRTQHDLGNQNIKIFNHGCQALTVTYFTATISGIDNSSEKVCCNLFSHPQSLD